MYETFDMIQEFFFEENENAFQNLKRREVRKKTSKMSSFFADD